MGGRFSRRERIDEQFIFALKLNKYLGEESILLKKRKYYANKQILKNYLDYSTEIYNKEYLKDLLEYH